MRKIVLMASVSLDGFMEGPNRELDWHLVDEEVHSYFNDILRPMSAFLDGRITHELMTGFWPTADQDPDSPEPIIEFAQIWRDKAKYVFSKTLQHAAWNTTIVRDVVAEDIVKLKAQPGGDMAVGGAELAATFRELDLIDEYHLYFHPIILGQGNPLFQPTLTREPLTLTETRTFGNGVVMLRYSRGRG